ESNTGWVLDSQVNNAVIAVNRLLKAGVPVQRLPAQDGAYFVPAGNREALLAALHGTGVVAAVAGQGASAGGVPMRAPRIALWDRYGGSMVSGWTRLVLENFGFDYEVVYPQQILAGKLR